MKHLFLVMLLLLTMSFACNRNKVEPKEPSELEYRVLSSSGAVVAKITYFNETGA